MSTGLNLQEIIRMIPLPIAGIAIAGSALLSKYTAARKAGKPEDFLKINPGPLNLPEPIKLQDLSDQLGNAIAGLRSNVLKSLKSGPVGNLKPEAIGKMKTNVLGGFSSAISQFTKSLGGEDYYKTVKGFIPADAVLIKPRHFSNTGELGLADLDGDQKEELIASYKSSSGVGTIVLKKYNEQWFKEGELLLPGYDSISFRDISDVAGTGKQQLLLGFPSADRKTVLHTYAFENGVFTKLFERSCSRFELLGARNTRNSSKGRIQLAFWDSESDGAYRIEVMQWNGLELEAVKDKTRYFAGKVIPALTQQVRRNPYSPAAWYNFANALSEAGYTEDALTALNTGLELDKTAVYTTRFSELKRKLS